MAEVKRITPEEARRRARDGDALLVCAYESEDLCKRNLVEGGMSLSEFNRLLPSLEKSREIIFYCA